MRFLPARRRSPLPPSPPGFGGWALGCFAGSTPLSELAFEKLEKHLANAASAVCGAVFADPEILAPVLPLPPARVQDAHLVARRTADGFRAALADPKNTVIVWPWEHLATLLAWRATRSGPLDQERLGEEMLETAGAYAAAHRQQLSSAFTMWTEVARGVRAREAPPADLAALGAELHRLYRATILGAARPAPISRPGAVGAGHR